MNNMQQMIKIYKVKIYTLIFCQVFLISSIHKAKLSISQKYKYSARQNT